MPPTIGSKSVETASKKALEYNNEQEIKKLQSVVKETENINRTQLEEDMILTKEVLPKPIKKATGIHKTKKNDDLERGKRVGSAIMDKIPKKNAQRAKGSIALGKSIDKNDVDLTGKKRPPSSSADKISRTNPREGETPDIPPQAVVLKAKTPEKPIRVRSNRKIKDTKQESKEEVKRVPSKKKKPWVSVLEGASNESLEEETMEVVEQNLHDSTMQEQHQREDMGLDYPPSSSCSFFEKIQQGVKAYFSSRNSLRGDSSTEEKLQKKVTDGGIRTGAGVGKGVKEDHKKEMRKVFESTGINLKNKISYPECDLFNRPRFKLRNFKSGGNISKFSSDKTKNLRNFRKLKRKKLYHPKKHYVRIQIPRKGYFYRSTFHIKDPEPSPASLLQRLEPNLVQKNESEIQISGMAPSSFKSADIFKKRIMKSSIKRKRLKSSTKKEVSFLEARNNSDELKHFLNSLQSNPSNIPSFTPEYLENISIFLNKQNKSEDSMASLNLFNDKFILPEIEVSLFANKNIDEFQEKFLKRSTKTVSRNSLNQNTCKLKRLSKRKSIQKTSKFFVNRKNEKSKNKSQSEKDLEYISGSSNERINCNQNYNNKIDINRRLDLPYKSNIAESVTSFENLMNCFDSALINENLNCSLEITSYTNLTDQNEKFELNKASDFKIMLEQLNNPGQKAMFKSMMEEPIQTMSEVVNAFDNFDEIIHTNDLSKEKFWISSASLLKSASNDGKKYSEISSSQDNFATTLIGDIDLHLELQNYLRTMDSCAVKTRTKNTLQQTHFNYSDAEDFEDVKFEAPIVLNICQSPYNCDSQTVFHDVGYTCEAKSSSSFISALSSTSTVPEEEKDSNNLRTYLDKKRDMIAASEELLDVKFMKTFTSQISLQVDELYDRNDEVRRIKSDYDSKKLKLNNKSKSFIKRTFGKTSFQLLKPEENDLLTSNIFFQSKLLNSTFSMQTTMTEFDTYEKISPLNNHSFQNIEEVKKKNNDNILYQNLVYSISAESLKQNMRNRVSPSCDLRQMCENTSSHSCDTHTIKTESFEALKEIYKLEKTSSSDIILKTKTSEGKKRWLPTLPELIDIYGAFLKKNQKIRRNSKNSIKRCISVLLFSFLDCKLKERKQKSDLIKLSKDIRRFKIKDPLNGFIEKWKRGCRKKDLSQIKEYTNLFQEILLSSLSINQITRLNNIMADLPNYWESNCNKAKKIKIKSKKKNIEKKKENSDEIKKTGEAFMAQTLQPKKIFIKKKSKTVKPNELQSKIKLHETKVPKKNIASQKTTKITKHQKIKEMKKNTTSSHIETYKKKLPSTVGLESILKTCLNTGPITKELPTTLNSNLIPDLKNKFLVSVKLCGDKIMVMGFCDFKNEKSLIKFPQNSSDSESEISDLIIENVSKDQGKNVAKKLQGKNLPKTNKSQKKLKNAEAKIRLKNSEISQNVKKLVKKTRVKNSKKITRDAQKKIDEVEKTIRIAETVEQKPTSLTTDKKEVGYAEEFEYNQQQLKTQHPIEAIVESSESKIDEYFESCTTQKELSNVFDHQSSILGKKPQAADSLENSASLDRILKNSKIFPSNSSHCNSTLFNEKHDNGLDRTKSSVIARPNVEFEILKLGDIWKKKKEKKSESLKCMDDTSLIKSSNSKKNRKILPMRPHTSFLCYSSFQNLPGNKTIKNKKKSEETKLVQKNGISSKGSIPGCSSEIISSKDSLYLPENLYKKNLEDSSKEQILNAKELKEISHLLKRPNLLKEMPPYTTDDKIIVKSLEKKIKDEKLTTKSSTNTTLFLNTEINPKCCSVEFLYNDKNVNKSSNTSPKSSNFEVEEKKTPTSIQNSFKANQILSRQIYNPASKKQNYSRNSLINLKNHQDSPIIIHTSKCGHDDTSFPSLMIQSDSFLKSHSTFAITKSKVKSLFKSNSDMKFYPGKISESQEHPPFVTFVLTPKQKAMADIPSNQVIVAGRMKTLNNNDAKENFQADEVEEKIPLQSIEKFIDILTKSRLKAIQQRKELIQNKNILGKKTTQSPSSMKQKKNCFMPCQRLQALFSSDRKVYHECQKRKLSEMTIKARSRLEIRNRNGNKSKSKILTDASNFLKLRKEKTLKKENKDPACKRKLLLENCESDGDKKNEILKETKAENVKVCGIGELTKKNTPQTVHDNNNHISLSPEWIQLIKTAVKRASGLKKKEEIVAAIEEYSKNLVSTNEVPKSDFIKREENLELLEKASEIKNDNDSETIQSSSSHVLMKFEIDNESKSSNTPKKVTTFKIKIHCNNRNLDFQPNVLEKIPQQLRFLLIKEKVKNEEIKVKRVKNIELLDSLISNKETDLTKKSSTYFDAIDGEPDIDQEKVKIPPTAESFSSKIFLPPGHQKGFSRESVSAFRKPLLNTLEENFKQNHFGTLTSADKSLLAINYTTSEWEDLVLKKVITNLKTNNECYSALLLKNYLKKLQKFHIKKLSRSAKLKGVLRSVENKNKNLINNLEKNGWSKILFLLENISNNFKKLELPKKNKIDIMEISEFLNCVKKQLKTSKALIDKIQAINDRKNKSSQNITSVSKDTNFGYRFGSVTCSRSLQSMMKNRRNVLFKIKNSFKELKNKFSNWSPPITAENFKSQDEDDKNNFKDSTKNDVQLTKKTFQVHQLNTSVLKYSFELPNFRNLLQNLKKQVRQQRLCIQYILNTNSGFVLPELQDVQSKVVKKMSSLENVLFELNIFLGLKIREESLTVKLYEDEPISNKRKT